MNKPKHIYHIFPLGALSHILELEEWGPHLKSLKIDAVLLGPVFESQNHGYDVIDLRKIDSRLGTWDDLKTVISNFHENGIVVYLDAVWNHTSREHFAYKGIQQKEQSSEFVHWYRNIKFDKPNAHGDSFTVEGWNGHQELPELNLLHNEVRQEIKEVVDLWIDDLQIDGVRIDAADVMDQNFLNEISTYAHSKKQDFWMLGEVIHGDYRNWLQAGGLDSVTHYEGYKSLWSSLNDKNFFEFAYSLKRLFDDDTGIYKGQLLQLFTENHDVSRVASILDESGYLYPLYILHYTVPGIPSLYHGSEWGLEGEKKDSDDWNLRPRIETVPPKEVPHPHLIDTVKRLAEIRTSLDALQFGGYKEVLVAHTHIAFIRTDEVDPVLIVVNSSSEKVTVDLKDQLAKYPAPGFSSKLYNILDHSVSDISHLEVPPYWGGIYISG